MKLTLPQQDIYFEQLLFPNDPIYNIGAKIEIKGVIDREIFKKSHRVTVMKKATFSGGFFCYCWWWSRRGSNPCPVV